VFAIDEPVIIPMKPEATTDTLAGPPRVWPTSEKAMRIRYSPAPVRSSTAPNSTNANTKVADTPTGMPRMPSVVR
jgi:hypothetical protein